LGLVRGIAFFSSLFDDRVASADIKAMRSNFFIKLILVTAVAVAVAFYAFASAHIRGLTPLSFKAVQIIRQRCPAHLVNPDSITGADQSEILARWSEAEVKARMALLSFLWLVTISGMVWSHGKKIKTSNGDL
jgi:hypothetical protein